jgi:hypothetical protein
VIKRYECNECIVEIASAMEIPESTLRTVRKKLKLLRQAVKVQ